MASSPQRLKTADSAEQPSFMRSSPRSPSSTHSRADTNKELPPPPAYSRPQSVRPSLGARTMSTPDTTSDTDQMLALPLSKKKLRTLKESIRDSIADDPFFRIYNSPDSQWISNQLKTRLAVAGLYQSTESLADEPLSPTLINTPDLPPIVSAHPTLDDLSARDVQSAWSSETTIQRVSTGQSDSTVQGDVAIQGDINIGIYGVGKTTFMDNALELKPQEHGRPRQKSINVEGGIYNVRLLELTFDDLCTLSQSEAAKSDHLPRIDGVVALYDVQDPESLDQVPGVIDALQEAALPTVLASPSDQQTSQLSLADASFIEQKAKSVMKDVNVLQTSGSDPESQKHCVDILLKDIVSEANSRPRSKSAAYHTQLSHQNQQSRNGLRPSMSHSDLLHPASTPESLVPRKSPSLLIPGSALADYAAEISFLELESPSIDRPISMGPSKLQFHQSHVPETVASISAATFDQLSTRLWSCQLTTKDDLKFIFTFLTFYRLFAAPSVLLLTLDDADALEEDDGAKHCLEILEFWITLYPGDFVHWSSRSPMERFLFECRAVGNLTVLAERISLLLDAVVETDDTHWVHADSSVRRPDSGRTFLSTSSVDHADIHSKPYTHDGTAASMDAKLLFGGSSIAVLNAMGPTKDTSSQPLSSLAEPAQRQAKLLNPNPSKDLTKAQWRLLMAQSDDDIARELTRMDWIMFSSLRTRDLIRHVTITNDSGRFPGLENVNRMIGHFNHIAFWVTNLVLLRDKPKHRAQILEKLMRVARKLRELNNYNALGALVAGIQGSAVHRLAQTRALVNPETQKDFMKLEILVSTQKSHFAYRLAWDNTSTERIPFLPLHRRDLVSAEAGNKTFLGDADAGKINWRKFEIMGDILMNLQRAQTMPYHGFAEHETIKSILLDCRISKDEDILYEKSLALEPPGGHETSNVKRKLTWLAKYYGFRGEVPQAILSAPLLTKSITMG